MKNDVYSIVTEKITKLLEDNQNPWVKPWVTRSLGSQKNLSSGRPYTGINALLLSMENRPSDYWLTFNQADELGFKIRKGEKSTIIIGWFKTSAKSSDQTNFETDESSDDSENSSKGGLRCRYFRVFNLSQFENVPESILEKTKRPDVQTFEHGDILSAEKIIQGLSPKLIFGVEQASYRPSTDTVSMPDKARFPRIEEYYSTMFHELGHWTGHVSRLARTEIQKINLFNSKAYSQEELCAEMTSVYVSSSLGISSESSTRNSVAYLQGWLKFLKDNPKAFVIACQQAQKAANYILENGNKN